MEYSGEDTLTLNVTDFGNTGSQDSNVLSNSIFTSTIIAHIMAVNDKPSLTISKNRHIYPLEDTKFLIQNAVTVHDFDLVSGEDKVEVLIEASMGNVSVNLTSYFVKAEGLNTKSVHLAGPVHLVAESLANGLTYIGDKDQNGADTIKFTAFAPNTKSAALEVEIIVDIQPVNDAPTITAPGSYSTVEDSETILSGIILSDVDANELFGSVVQASVSVNHGTISPGSYAGIRMVSDGIYRGGIVELQQAFKNLKYLPHENWYGMDTVVFTLNDLGNHGLGSAKNTTKTIAVSVKSQNDPPKITIPANYYDAQEDTTLQIDGVNVFDVDSNGGLYSVRMYARNGYINVDTNLSTGSNFKHNYCYRRYVCFAFVWWICSVAKSDSS